MLSFGIFLVIDIGHYYLDYSTGYIIIIIV
jgi:hypothetical protein